MNNKNLIGYEKLQKSHLTSFVNTIPGAIFATLHFFIAHKWAQQAKVLHYTKPERLAKEKHSSLFDPFLSYEEYEELLIRHQGPML